MIPYKNLGGDSWVIAYQYGTDFITVQFKEGTHTIYTYNYTSAGSFAIEKMKELADVWRGLNSYISTHKPPYISKK